MFSSEPHPSADVETMRRLARDLFSHIGEEEEESAQNPEAQDSPPPPGIRRITLPAEAKKADSPGIRALVLPEKEQPRPEPLPDADPQPAQSMKETSAAEEKRFSPAEETKAPFRNAEIRQTILRVRNGSLRPAFHVSRSPRRFSCLQEALDFSRRQLPLPREMQLSQQTAHRTWLTAQINHCPDQQALSSFAFSLNYKDLATLFPALASLKRGDEIDRIISIIMMRASKYLYIHGWITLQYAYPRFTVQKGLAELCEVLETQRRSEEKNHAGRNESNLPPLRLGADRFDWKSVRMISEISMPNTRHFLASMIRFIRDSGMSGDEFFNTYGIYRELPLGQAVSSQWEMAMFEENLSRSSGSVSPVRKLFRAPVEITGMQEF